MQKGNQGNDEYGVGFKMVALTGEGWQRDGGIIFKILASAIGDRFMGGYNIMKITN